MADGYESIEVLIVASNEARKEWILDLGCYFHMTPNKEWFKTYNDQEGGSILLRNNKSCKVIGIGSIRFKLPDGIEKKYLKKLGMCQI